MKNRGILLLLLILLLTGGTAGCLKESALSISGIVIAPQTVGAGQAVLNVSTTVQNIFGFGNAPARLRLQAFDTATGLLAQESVQEIGTIGRGETVIVRSELILPRKGTYRILATVFEGSRQRAQGEITVYSLERLPADAARTSVGITDMDFTVRAVSAGRASIEAEIYFTNQGAEASPPLTVEVKVREKDARLTADRQWTAVADIRPDATVTRNVTLSVPDQYNYEVEAILWRDDVIVERGVGNVLLAPSTKAEKGGDFITKKIETGQFIAAPNPAVPRGEPTMVPRQPGFGLAAALSALAIVVATGRWLNRV